MTPSTGALALAAESYLEAGLCALPAVRNGDVKRPAVGSWKAYQNHLPTFDEIRQSFDEPNPTSSMCIVCGAVSQNLEMIDFDLAGEAFEPWKKKVEATSPGLLDRLVIETSPSGGFHVVYRCQGVVSGNMKLAQRRIECDDAEPLVVASKSYTPRQDAGGKWHILVTMIETRGEGGLFLCAPSPGYEIIQGDLRQPPVLTANERTALLECAWSLDENKTELVAGISPSVSTISPSNPLKPGDDFNRRGDVREILIAHGWKPTRTTADGNEHWTRPGKANGTSATLKDENGVPLFFVHSTNAPPFDAGKAYSPFAVFSLLEHNGDYTAAASALGAKGYAQTPDTMSDAALATFTANSPQSAPSGDTAQPTLVQQAGIIRRPKIVLVGELVKQYPKMRPPVIHGLLREGETMNIIAAAKVGKSWLSLDLAIAVARGEKWLDRYDTVAGKVLIVDNELHKETTAHRIPLVADARNVPMRQIAYRVGVDNVRGDVCDIHQMESQYFAHIEPCEYKLILLDAFYRFLPGRESENDNAAMKNAFNTLDKIASRLKCCIVLIHHASKGSQTGKDVTDVGAGAGSQSRAADSHLILRPHEEEHVVVLEAVARSWEPIEPVCLRWKFPVWNVDGSLDPADLKTGRQKKRKDDGDDGATDEPGWNVERFVEEFISEEPVSLAELRDHAVQEPGLSWRRVSDFLDIAEARYLIHKWSVGRSHKAMFSIVPQPATEENKS